MFFVSWTNLMVKELQDLCITCRLFTGSNKEELGERLQGYFEKKKEKLSETHQKKNSVELEESPERRIDELNSEVFADDRVINLEGDVLEIGFQKADYRIGEEFAAHFQSKERIDAKMEEEELLEESWPGVKLLKPCDQHEYDFLAKVDKWLDRVILILSVFDKKEFTGIREEIETHAVMLRSKYNQNKQKRSKDHLSATSSDSKEDDLYKKTRKKERMINFFLNKGEYSWAGCQGLVKCFNCEGISHITSNCSFTSSKAFIKSENSN
ncbi:1263_t:CDS:2 [Cetraspora pellucida]|uniref:1263_t:CDS:1 n=1 Tax=Cetraspora pellucida TaxID=1433469 RepID=A0A9N9FAY4_9GLOM|nr:1263_t:CDS:2 [Cetraspora pellucida]